MVFSNLIRPALLILVPLTMGIFCKKYNLFEDFFEKLYKAVVFVILPALVFGAIAINDPPKLTLGSSIVVLALVCVGVTALITALGTYLKGLNREESTEVFINAAFMNYTFLGLAVVQSVLGQQPGVLGYASLYAVSIGVIHLPISLILAKSSAGEKATVKEIFVEILSFPAFFALIVALLFQIFPVLPPFHTTAKSIYNEFANVASFFMVLATGYKMEIGRFRKHLSKIFGIGVLRLVIGPLVTWGMILALGLLNSAENIAYVALILSIMPPGVFNIIIAERFGLDIESYGSIVFYLTIISLFIALPILIILVF